VSYIPTIGLEIHTQLNTKTKLFCSCRNDSGETGPNVNICPVCMGHPGTLPVLNRGAVEKIVRAGVAINCRINQRAKFDRKHYFYPDLPKGYQISQYDIPFCVDGTLALASEETIRVHRIHLEEDAGRLVHEGGNTLVDFNRAGMPLMELVTEPDFHTSEDAVDFAKKLQTIWRYVGISEADMEKGEFRVEANISLREIAEGRGHDADIRRIISQDSTLELGTKVEVKNLNSFKAVRDAIEYEIKRQKEVLEKGEKVAQETRGWDAEKRITFSQRTKETAKDYRYFPEPDLPPVVISDEELKSIRESLPELPWERKTRFVRDFGIDLEQAEVLVDNKESGEYAEDVISELTRWERDTEKPNVTREHMPQMMRLAVNYVVTEIPRIALALEKTRQEVCAMITPENFAELIVLTHHGEVSSSAAQAVFLEMAKTGGDPHHIINEKGLAQVSGKDDLKIFAKEVIALNEKAVADFRKGKETALTFLVGQMMAKSKGKANPQVAREVLENILKQK